MLSYIGVKNPGGNEFKKSIQVGAFFDAVGGGRFTFLASVRVAPRFSVAYAAFFKAEVGAVV